jgi:hypothetical protein
LCELPPQRGGIDVVDERALAADLHHRQPLTVSRLELRVAGDLDLVVRDAGLVEDAARALAEVAVARVVERDDGYG